MGRNRRSLHGWPCRHALELFAVGADVLTYTAALWLLAQTDEPLSASVGDVDLFVLSAGIQLALPRCVVSAVRPTDVAVAETLIAVGELPAAFYAHVQRR